MQFLTDMFDLPSATEMPDDAETLRAINSISSGFPTIDLENIVTSTISEDVISTIMDVNVHTLDQELPDGIPGIVLATCDSNANVDYSNTIFSFEEDVNEMRMVNPATVENIGIVTEVGESSSAQVSFPVMITLQVPRIKQYH